MKPTYTVFAFMAFSTLVYAKQLPQQASPNQITIPQATVQTVPVDYISMMNHQADRLNEIDKNLAVVDKTVSDMSQDMKELVATNHVLNFLVGSLKLLVPGLIIMGFGIWLNRKFKDQVA